MKWLKSATRTPASGKGAVLGRSARGGKSDRVVVIGMQNLNLISFDNDHIYRRGA
jgi:hypothetical protein